MIKNIIQLVVKCGVCGNPHDITDQASIDFFGSEIDAGGWIAFKCPEKNEWTDLDLDNDHNI